MKTRTTIVILAALNVISFGAVGYLMTARPTESRKENLRQISPTEPPKIQPRARLRPTTALSTPASGSRFHWKEVESTDYKDYIVNLRAIGCPEVTIRDIIVADVNKLFAARTGALSASAREYKYWQTGAAKDKLVSQNQRQLKALNQEKAELLKTLLGPDVENDLRALEFGASQLNEDLMYGFLPDAKRSTVRDLIDKYQASEREIQQRSNGLLTPWDRKEIKTLQEQKNA